MTTSTKTRSEPNRWAVLALLGVAQLMVVLDATIVNIALPSAQTASAFLDDQPAVDRSRLMPSHSAACCCSAASSATCSGASGRSSAD